ncbi:EscU/YscU/HrcU family type III secretion system export apparatus switch protein [Alteribacter aurantiacus]|uniref:EscU/YscU/HrcU family type III secretion system export apparatus switch protein n=1 Tax=Alteribacter aurantiacus TaxID=254410 RepID=UPI0003F58CF9|nr:EscU/YscU/HrcU family type III secretion system export apparatus switch protein [Alteribacter aurantiacus]
MTQKRAVALEYDQSHSPKVKAKGKGYLAEKIIQKAKENALPIQEDPSLVQLLSELEINEEIPEDLYEAVAEVFAFVYRLDKEQAKKLSGKTF